MDQRGEGGNPSTARGGEAPWWTRRLTLVAALGALAALLAIGGDALPIAQRPAPVFAQSGVVAGIIADPAEDAMAVRALGITLPVLGPATLDVALSELQTQASGPDSISALFFISHGGAADTTTGAQAVIDFSGQQYGAEQFRQSRQRFPQLANLFAPGANVYLLVCDAGQDSALIGAVGDLFLGVNGGRIWAKSGSVAACNRFPYLLYNIETPMDPSSLPFLSDWQSWTHAGASQAPRPTIDLLRCSPDPVSVGKSTTCTVRTTASGTTSSWFVSPIGANDQIPDATNQLQTTLTFGEAGSKSVKASVCDASVTSPSESNLACTTRSISLEVILPPPTINSVSCAPNPTPSGESVGCLIDGDEPTGQVVWTATPSEAGDSQIAGDEKRVGRFVFKKEGSRTITVVACNGAAASAVATDPGCATANTSLTVNPPPAPTVDSVTCDPATVAPAASVRCTASVSGTVASRQWSASGGQPSSGTAEEFSTSFASEGDATVELKACSDTAGATCNSGRATVKVQAPAPTITAVGCAPATVDIGKNVACSPTVGGTTGLTSYSWAAPDGSPSTGSGATFSTSYASDGSKNISLTVCNGSACANQRQTITVNAPQAPTIRSVDCSPTPVETGKQVTCRVMADGTVTSQTWTATDGNPASGTSASFTTSYATSGRKAISVQVCNGATACATGQGAVEVTVAGLPAGTTTLNGGFTMDQAGTGRNCQISYAPRTNGTFNLTLTIDAASPTGTVSGRFSGSGSGSGRGECNGVTGNFTWSQTYSGTFSGTVDRTTGALINVTGTLTGNQSNRNFDCVDRDNKTVTCGSPPSGPYTFPIRVTGTVARDGSSARGDFAVQQINLATNASWSVSR